MTFKTKDATIKGVGKKKEGDTQEWEKYIVEYVSGVEGSFEKDGEMKKFDFNKKERELDFRI